MLARRILRIKVFQSLYSIHTLEQGNHQAGFDMLMDEMKDQIEYIDATSTQKEGYEKLADATWKPEKPDQEDETFSLPNWLQSLIGSHKATLKNQNEKDRRNVAKKLALDLEVVTGETIGMLNLMINLMEKVNEKEEVKQTKHFNNQPSEAHLLKFAQHPILLALKQSDWFEKETKKLKKRWFDNEELVHVMYRDCLLGNEYYQEYMAMEAPTPEAHASMLKNLVKQMMKHKVLHHDMIDLDLNWIENSQLATIELKKATKVAIQQPDFVFGLDVFQSEKEDMIFFMNELFSKTLEYQHEWLEIAAEKLEKWEVGRLALSDRQLYCLALTEMAVFQHIPIKVTLNEVLEISKTYSTPDSYKFLNGMLDKVSTMLLHKGRIKKSGKGLMDNK
jgi:N utilization substance protein B